MYGTHYERSKRAAIRSALAAPTPDSFPEIELTPPPGAPTPEEIRERKAEIKAENLERKRTKEHSESPGWSKPPGIRECRVLMPKRKPRE
jgi:hypothetical protein